jgi:hypothetical protein
MNCKRFSELVYFEPDAPLTGEEKAGFERHAQDCPSCAGRLAESERLIRLLQDAPPVPAPDWDKSWQRIAAATAPAPRRPLLLPGLPHWAMLTAAFLAVFSLGVAVARLVFFPAKAQLPSLAEPAFIYTPAEYFAALQPVMASVANVPASQGSAPAEQARVRQLLGDLRLLKLRAAKSRDASLQHLLGDIEVVLLEIVHVDRSDPERVRQLGAMIQEKGISLKMKVYRPEGRKSLRI